MNKRNEYFLLLLLVALKFILQYSLIDPVYELHRDEYLHLDQGKHLAWGFLSVAPFTSWISYFILKLGNGVFWVKFFPALFGALTVTVCWFAIEELKGKLFAKIIVSLALIFSVILRINLLYQPNSLDILCWTLFYFSIIKYLQSEKNKWLYIAAAVFAVGFLNKYNILFLLTGLTPALLLTSHRKIFLNIHLYLAAVLALLIISPNLTWQYNNNYPVYHHMKLLAATQLINVNRADFLKSQFIFFYNSIFILAAAIVGFIIYKPFAKYRVILYSIVVTLLLFIYFKAKDYYSIGVYPLVLVFGSIYLENILSNGWKQYLRPVALLLVIISSLPFLKIAFPVYPPEQIAKKLQSYRSLGLLRWEDGKDHILPQDFADMLGWKELAGKVDYLFDTIKDKSHTIVLCDNYGQAGAINYYSKFKSMGAVSMNADYINWFPPDSLGIKNIIFVKQKNDSNRMKEKPLFDTILLAGKITNIFAREQGANIYLLLGARTNINAILQKEIEERKRY